MKHCHFVADDKGQSNVFDKSVTTVSLSFETVLKTSGPHRFQPDGTHSKLLLLKFQSLVGFASFKISRV